MKELFNDGKIQVRTNGSEIFVTRLHTHVPNTTLRIGTVRHWDNALSLIADNSTFEPTSFNGLGGFIIR